LGLQKIDGTLIWNKHPLHSTDTQQTTVSHQERARTIGSLSSTLATPSHEALLVQDWIQEGLYPWRHKALPIHHEEYITRVSVEFQLQELLQIPLQHLSSGQLATRTTGKGIDWSASTTDLYRRTYSAFGCSIHNTGLSTFIRTCSSWCIDFNCAA
jgi:hypothetical protein